MPPPAPLSAEERGKRWLQARVLQRLATGGVALAASRLNGDVPCYWGTDLDTATTLYLRLAGEPEPHALAVTLQMMEGCATGLRLQHDQGRLDMRRRLRKMGILSAEQAGEVP